MSHQQDAPDEHAEARLSALFASFREVCPDPESGPDFMPRLWRKIESRQTFSYNLKRIAQGIITAAAAVSLLMGLYLAREESRPSPFYTATYVELLASGQPQHADSLGDDTEIVEAVHERSR